MMFWSKRSQHIQSYVNHPNLSPSTRKVGKNLYETVFQCCGGNVYVLRVDCSNNEFAVSLYGMKVQHSLIDTDGNVRMATGKLLGAALMDTVVQLQMQPPLILEVTEAAVAALQQQQQRSARSLEPAHEETTESYVYPQHHHRRQPSVDPPTAAMPMSEIHYQQEHEATAEASYTHQEPDFKDQVRSTAVVPIVHGIAIVADNGPSSLSC